MIPIKRLLNDDNNDDHRGHSGLARRRSPSAIDELSDTPAIPHQSWADLVGGLLHSSLNRSDEYLASSSAGIDATLSSYARDRIEEWASSTQDLCSSVTRPSRLEQPTIGTTLEPSVNDFNAQVCYGMIYHASVKLVGDMAEVDRKLDATGYHTFRITNSSTQLLVTFLDGTTLGFLNAHTTTALQDLIERPSVQFDAHAHTLTLREKISKATTAGDAVAHMNINVYGSAEAIKDVGRHLSANKVYLQRPDQQRPGSTYDNPQFLRIPHMQDLILDCQPQEMGDSISQSDIGNTEQFQKAVVDVYCSLKRGSRLEQVEGDNRLTTTLLRHQQEALHFMIQRESGPVPPEFLLWQPSESDGQVWYRHAVTGVKSTIQHPETGGGILADEMGMGKSLSILSLVVRTLEDAHSWASDPSASLSNGVASRKKTSRATLILLPSALLINSWLKEVERHLDGSLKIINYHGQKRETRLNTVEDADIVLTTYHTLAADFRSRFYPLKEVAWFRIVLDEAHIIRRQATDFYRSVSELDAKFRWCVTGTPIQNRLEDIGALLAFIRIRPFDSLAVFRRFIAVPFDESVEHRAIASYRLCLLLDSVCLRRMRDRLDLPKEQEETRYLDFSREERDQYGQTQKIMIRAIRQRAGEPDSKSMFGMFQAQLQLRIFCNHGTFQHPFSWATSRSSLLDEREDALSAIGQNGEINCSSCRQVMPIFGSNNVYRPYVDNCAHILCSECLEQSADDSNIALRCPLCAPPGAPMATAELGHTPCTGREERDDSFRSNGHSSKMAALMLDVREHLWEHKSIIFSCWTRTLDLIASHLNKESIPFERIDGQCPPARRQKVLDAFAQHSGVPVLIMTTGTGAFGLNLASANRVFIVEPQWNPSVENQAIARTLRLGQERSVLVRRYVVKSTVEQDMRSQQNRKLMIAQMGWKT